MIYSCAHIIYNFLLLSGEHIVLSWTFMEATIISRVTLSLWVQNISKLKLARALAIAM